MGGEYSGDNLEWAATPGAPGQRERGPELTRSERGNLPGAVARAERTSSGDDPERAAIGPEQIARAESTSSGDDPERALKSAWSSSPGGEYELRR